MPTPSKEIQSTLSFTRAKPPHYIYYLDQSAEPKRMPKTINPIQDQAALEAFLTKIRKRKDR
jgi:hypothetical protein